MATFLSGFAEGFTRARERTEDRDQQQEDMTFKYKMDNLVKMKEKREAKSAQEAEIARQAASLASQFGDDKFATVALQEIKLGVPPETIQKRMGEGYYVKNNDYVAPTQTLKVPSAVSGTKNSTFVDPLVSADPKMKKVDEAVNKRIDQLDPTLRKDVLSNQDELTSTTSNPGAYIFKPKNEVKIGDLNDSMYKLYKAQQAGDPVQIKEAQAQVDINRRVETERAVNQARANGKNVDAYFSINPDGSVNTQLPGELREDGLYNVADPMNPQKVSGKVIRMGDDDLKRYNSLVDDFGKASKDYNTNAESFVNALHSSQQMTEILHNDPEAATLASKGLGILESLSGEAQAAYSSVLDLEKNIQVKVQSGKTDGIEKDIMDHAKSLDSLLKQGVLSDANQQKVINAAKYNSLKMQTAYQIAQATSTDGKVSNQDLANAMETIGSNSDPKQILSSLGTQMQGAFLKLQSSQATLNRNASVTDFEKRYGIKTGLKGQRIGDIIAGTDLPEDQKQNLMKYLGGITKNYAQGQAETQNSIQEQPKDQPIAVKSKDEYDKLPKGAVYLDPTGKKRTKN